MTSVCAESGRHAIEQLLAMRRENAMPQVLLTDVHMPAMDGIEMVRQLRRTHGMEDEFVIITLTSGGLLEDTEELDALGISAQLQKPLKQSELLESILEAVSPMLGAASVGDRDGDDETLDIHSIPHLRVLLAEDGLANQKLAIGLLSKWGHEVTVAANGKEAIEHWQTREFDLILMDLQMPEMDGLTATRRIRDREQQDGTHIPIIAMTAHALKGDRELCMEAGMDGYIAKPVRKNDLIETLQPIFANSKTRM